MTTRRIWLGLAGAAAATVAGLAFVRSRRRTETVPDIRFDDPAAPVGGNAHGDLGVAAFFDYNCPYCRAAAPELERFVAGDGRVRLVYKDWPILGEASVTGARLALAAAHQGRYEAAHRALMLLPGRRATEAPMREALWKAGIDMARLQADLSARAAEIAGQLARNADHARALGLRAVPTILVGPHMVVGGFDVENFQIFAQRARAAAFSGSPASPARL